MLDEEQAGEEASLVVEEDEKDRPCALAVQEDPASMSILIDVWDKHHMYVNIPHEQTRPCPPSSYQAQCFPVASLLRSHGMSSGVDRTHATRAMACVIALDFFVDCSNSDTV